MHDELIQTMVDVAVDAMTMPPTEAQIEATKARAMTEKEVEAATSADPTTPEEAQQAFQRYVIALAEKARNSGARWSAAHSRQARGALSGHWMTAPKTLTEASEILALLELPSTFTLDIAADPGSAVAADWFGPMHFDSRRRDALAAESWRPERPGAVWLNAPYSKIADFAKRSAEYEALPLLPPRAPSDLRPLMFLAFARPDTRWFNRYVTDRNPPTWFHEGRLKFGDPVTGKVGNNVAPAPSFLSIYGVKPEHLPEGWEMRTRRVGRWRLVRFP